MTTADLPDDGALVDGDEGATEPGSLLPSVVAVVVTRNPGPWLEQTLRSLGEQDYPALRVLVVDAASGADPSARVAAVLPRALVRRVTDEVGFAAGANEALHDLDGATFLMLCHDDVVLDPPTVRLLLEEAYRSNAAIIGPKIVDADNPEVLLEVGRSIDRFGGSHTGIEPGEIDQEQHDGVRDVFYVSSAAMLVRADLFHELGGFDPDTFPGAEDLDLCWRARLAGARVMVAPDARVRHREAAGDRGADDVSDPVAIARSRIRAVLISSSFATLLWLVPVGIVTAFLEATFLTLTFRRGRLRSALGGWWWNFRRLGEVREARSRAQSLRRVQDSDLRELQVRSARVRGFVSHYFAGDERLQSIGDTGRSAVNAAASGARRPTALAAAALAFLFLVGSRELVTGTVPAAGTLAHWPGLTALFSAFASGWRYTGLGSPASAPPALALMGALSAVFLGADGLARTVLVLAAFPVGAWGAYRVTRLMFESTAAAVVAGLAYAITPVPRNALAAGRWGPLVLFALAPFLLSGLLRLARALPDTAPPRTGRALLGLAVLTALTTAFFPLAPLALAVLSVAVVLAVPLVGGLRVGLRMLGVSVVSAVAAGVLLFPWPLAYAGHADAAALGFAFRPRLGLSEVLRLQSGPAGAGWVGWGLFAAAAFPLGLAGGTRLVWAVRGWLLALLGWAFVFVPARFATDRSVPAAEAGLALAALGLTIAIGAGVATIVADVRRFRFGWRQLAVAVAAAGLLFPALGFAFDAVDGRWHAADGDWARALGFLSAERDSGSFRVLWLGDPAVVPYDPAVGQRGVGYALTRDGPGDARELWRAPERRADRLVSTAIALAADGRTNRLGHLLAPMGVRYVAVPSRAGPGSDVQAPPERAMTTALGDQLDLARLESRAGLVLYENAAWIPTRALVRKRDARAVPLRSRDPTRAALRSDLSASPVKGPLTGSAPTGPGTVLWSEAFDDRWKATAAGAQLDHVEPFGWANGYVLPSHGRISIRYDGQLVRYGAIAIEVAIWLGVIALAVRTRRGASGGGRTPRGEQSR